VARIRILLLLAAVAASACSKQEEPAQVAAPAPPAPAPGPASPPAVWFEEVAQASGLTFRHRRGDVQRFWFPEVIGAGLAWFDYDGDGKLDLYCVQSGDLRPEEGQDVPGDVLYRNRGDGTFEDVTAKAGLGDRGYGMGCAVGDYDGDGDRDLYVTNYGTNVLYRNEGNGTFTDVTKEAGVGYQAWGTSTGFFDCDGDRDLDLFVVNYVRWAPEREVECRSNYGERDYCAPVNYNAPSRAVLYKNVGGGKFVDASEQAGLGTAFGNGLGLALADFDRDGRLDAYVSNDGNPNQLWINQGGGRFLDKALLFGAAVNRNGASEASMGTVPVDVDENGWIDIFITNLRGESNTMYFNERGIFTDKTPKTGLAAASLPYTGFGDGFADFDHDGRLDLYVVNGRVGFWKPFFLESDVYAEPNQLFRGLEGSRFEETQPPGGTAVNLIGTSRGAAFGDYDDDGDVDIAYSDNNAPVRLLRNVAPKVGHWIEMHAVDERGDDAIGATVEIHALGRTMRREVALCSSYCSSNDPRVHFGLGQDKIAGGVAVRWADGTREEFGDLPAEQFHVLQRGKGKVGPR